MNPQHVEPRSGWAVWLAGLTVVVAAGAATAHGLYEVALGSGTPPLIAWLYPVITDGLALVAYAATTRLAGPGRRYAWSVVVLAAGLSGLAQATYLAGSLGVAPVGLRFGVGAWPAVAAAIAAHLLFLITAVPGPAPRWDGPDPSTDLVPTVPPELDGAPLAEVEGAPRAEGLAGRPNGMRRALSQAGRAEVVAELHQARTGSLPSVRELAELADVGRGTADRALSALRTRASGLHVVNDPPDEGTNR